MLAACMQLCHPLTGSMAAAGRRRVTTRRVELLFFLMCLEQKHGAQDHFSHQVNVLSPRPQASSAYTTALCAAVTSPRRRYRSSRPETEHSEGTILLCILAEFWLLDADLPMPQANGAQHQASQGPARPVSAYASPASIPHRCCFKFFAVHLQCGCSLLPDERHTRRQARGQRCPGCLMLDQAAAAVRRACKACLGIRQPCQHPQQVQLRYSAVHLRCLKCACALADRDAGVQGVRHSLRGPAAGHPGPGQIRLRA